MKHIKQDTKSKPYKLVNTRSGSIEIPSADLTLKEYQTLNIAYFTNKSDLRWKKI